MGRSGVEQPTFLNPGGVTESEREREMNSGAIAHSHTPIKLNMIEIRCIGIKKNGKEEKRARRTYLLFWVVRKLPNAHVINQEVGGQRSAKTRRKTTPMKRRERERAGKILRTSVV